jgi:hypothetical protein
MFVTVGAVVASRRPENSIGWIFCTAGFLLSAAVLASAYVTYALYISPGQPPGVEYAAWFAGSIPLPALFLTATLLFLLFPNGRFLSPEWRFVAGVAVVGCVMTALGDGLGRDTAGTDLGSIRNPFAIGGSVGDFLLMLEGVGATLTILSALASVTSSFARWVRARGQERQQLKWFAYAAAMMIGGFLLAFMFGSSELMWDLGFLVGFVGFALLPLTTAIAILKYRPYDIDRIINRTLVYASLTVTLGAVYFGGIVMVQRVFVVLTGERSTLAVVASTLLIAALFNPLRKRIQSFIDRRFYRRKYDAAKTLAGFSANLRDETNLEALKSELIGVVGELMQPAYASLWLRTPTEAGRSGESSG